MKHDHIAEEVRVADSSDPIVDLVEQVGEAFCLPVLTRRSACLLGLCYYGILLDHGRDISFGLVEPVVGCHGTADIVVLEACEHHVDPFEADNALAKVIAAWDPVFVLSV